MASRSKRVCVDSALDYEQLNFVSSVMLYDTVPQSRKRGRFYEVERIISRRTVRHDHEYLIKWLGWPLESCSWEPSSNLTSDLLRNYAFPLIVKDQRLQEASRAFTAGIIPALKNPSTSPIYIGMELDIWRYVTANKGVASEHRGHFLFERNDLSRLKYIPGHWWYLLDKHGEGLAIDFPVKVKPVLSWTPSHFFKKDGKLCQAPRFPIEKICVTIVKRACNVQNVD